MRRVSAGASPPACCSTLSLAAGAPSAGAWWYIVPPGLCITVLVFAIGLIGYALEHQINPRLQDVVR